MKIVAGDTLIVMFLGTRLEFGGLLSLLEAVEWGRTLHQGDKEIAANMGQILRDALKGYEA